MDNASSKNEPWHTRFGWLLLSNIMTGITMLVVGLVLNGGGRVDPVLQSGDSRIETPDLADHQNQHPNANAGQGARGDEAEVRQGDVPDRLPRDLVTIAGGMVRWVEGANGSFSRVPVMIVKNVDGWKVSADLITPPVSGSPDFL